MTIVDGDKWTFIIINESNILYLWGAVCPIIHIAVQ